MYYTFAEMISFVSQSETLCVGDFLGSGTVGKGCGWELDRWIQPGDVIELEVEGMGCSVTRLKKKRKIQRRGRKNNKGRRLSERGRKDVL